MTTKLKRKLENIGIDVRSNSTRLTENFCLIGTPLPPLEKSKDTGEFVPVWKQDVRDEKGRRRLHGAFTGGFSAGYYNTVGSKEGWTPATFISSRADRAKAKQARPEDFMDEEDIAELKESRKLVDTTEEHDMFADTRAELARRGGGAEKDSMAAALESLLPAAKDSIGARLLKKMGWKAGQGIGPRITYQQLRAQEGNPIQPNEPIDEEATKHLYAPRDTRVAFITKKDNSFGLGYAPGDGLTNLVHGGGATRDGGSRGSGGAGINVESGPNISAGFGLGALNEAEDDDIDVYERSGGSKMHRHMAYDAREDDETDEHIVIGPRFPAKPTSRNVVGSGTFKDGRPVASGFVVSEVPLIENRWFPLPDVPKGWVPDPRRVWSKDPSTKQDGLLDSNPPLPPSSVPDRRPWIKSKTADERGAMLGETPLPSAPRSVFDYLSQKDRDRLKNLGASIASGTAFPKTAPQSQTHNNNNNNNNNNNTSIDIPTLTPQIAQAAMKGFQPFTKDPEKHARYTVYLQSQSTPDTAPALRPMPGQSSDEFKKELADYVKSAQIFKPVSGAMASRFASSATVEVVGVQHPGLYQPTQEDYAKIDMAKNEDKEKKEKEEEEEDPKKHAARLNMFGHLTREERVWLPARLLLKRFGVRDPYPDGVPGGEEQPTSSAAATSAKNDAWQTEVLKVAPELNVPPPPPSSTDTASSKPLQRDLANIGLGDDEEQGKDTLTYERPAMDIFKAIFASDDEDSEDGDDEKEEQTVEEEPLTEPPATTSAPPISQHLPTTYEPTVDNNKENTGKVDLSTFKPTFIPQSERGGDKKREDKERRDKKSKKKKGKIVVSFDVEEDGGNVGPPTTAKSGSSKKERPSKRIKDKVVNAELEDESMWVEKPPPEVVKDLVLPVLTDPVPEEDITSMHPRGRKRAVDFI